MFVLKRSAATLLLLAVLAASPPAPRAAPPPVATARIASTEELIARHIEAIGGERAIGALRTVRSICDVEFASTGMKGTMESYFLLPCLSFSEVSFGFFTIRQGFDGERIWMIDANGKLQFQQDEESKRNQITTCIIESYRYRFPSDEVAVTLLEPDTLEGVPCEVLELLPRGGNRCTMHINAESFLVEALVVESKLGNVKQTFADYRPVGGIMIPFHTTMEQTAVNQTVEILARSVECNVPVDAVIFLPPAQDVRDYRFAEGRSSERVPFRYHNRHIYLPVRLEGESGEPQPEEPRQTPPEGPRGESSAAPEAVLFMLDSGAGMTVIDTGIAEERNLDLGGAIPGAGAGGMAEFRLVRIPPFAVGGIEFDAQRGISYAISTLTERFSGLAASGILGYDFLSRFAALIDYENRVITFFEPDSFRPAEGAAVLEAPLVHNIFSVAATLDGAYRGTFLIDTGANQSILQRSFIEEHRLTEGRKVLEIALLGAGGRESASLARFDSIEIGGMAVPRPVLALSASETGIGAFEGIGGIIGNDILEQFTVTLDYRNQRVLLEKNARFGEQMLRDRSGMGLGTAGDRRIVVRLVIPGTPADAAGIREGDEVVSIDGVNAAEYGSLDEIIRLFEAAPGTERRLVLERDGETIRAVVVLESYL